MIPLVSAPLAHDGDPKIDIQTNQIDYLYMDKIIIAVSIHNPYAYPITITKVSGYVISRQDQPPFIHSETVNFIIQPQKHHRQQLELYANPILTERTNLIDIELEWMGDCKRSCHYRTGRYIVLQPLVPPNKKVFISHKDPEDNSHAITLSKFLQRVGIDGYLAFNDKKPGINIWAEKIPLEISESAAVAIIWSRATLIDPKNIIRELELARDSNKHIILALEYGLKPPQAFPTGIEYFGLTSPISDVSLSELTTIIFKLIEEKS